MTQMHSFLKVNCSFLQLILFKGISGFVSGLLNFNDSIFTFTAKLLLLGVDRYAFKTG